MISLLLLRHAESSSIVQEEDSLILDDETNVLTDAGRIASVELGELLRTKFGSIIVHSSPSSRAYETAKNISDGAENILLDERLRERAFNFPLTTPTGESRKYQMQSHMHPHERILGGESIADHRIRVGDWFREFESKLAEEHVYAVVTHGGTLDQLLAIIFESPINAMSRYHVACEPARFHLLKRYHVSPEAYVWRLDCINACEIG
jgi:broad specificity phosphatase PhoE